MNSQLDKDDISHIISGDAQLRYVSDTMHGPCQSYKLTRLGKSHPQNPRRLAVKKKLGSMLKLEFAE